MRMISNNSKDLVTSIELDIAPNFATQVDFGMQPSTDPIKVFGALQWAYRRALTTTEELDRALGNGKHLTEIVNRESSEYGKNPYACKITTVWDGLTEDRARSGDTH